MSVNPDILGKVPNPFARPIIEKKDNGVYEPHVVFHFNAHCPGCGELVTFNAWLRAVELTPVGNLVARVQTEECYHNCKREI